MSAINLPWYKESSYNSLQKLRIGDPSFKPTYASWVLSTNNLEERIVGLGGKVLRFDVNTEEYLEWTTVQMCSPAKLVDVTSYVEWQSHQAALDTLKFA